jgi:hypothetical protein
MIDVFQIHYGFSSFRSRIWFVTAWSWVVDGNEVVRRATEILNKYQIGKNFSELVEKSYKLKSTSTVGFSTDSRNLSQYKIAQAVTISRSEQKLILGVGELESGSLPDGDFYSIAEVFVYFDKKLVLHTSAHQDIDDYGRSSMSILISPGRLKAFKAGPWLALLKMPHQPIVPLRIDGRVSTKVELDGLI